MHLLMHRLFFFVGNIAPEQLQVVGVNGVSTAEEIADARESTDENALEYLRKAKSGELRRENYIPVRKDTPKIIIDALKQVNEKIETLSLIMQVKKAQQSMGVQDSQDRNGRGGKNKRKHGLTPENILEIVNNLDNPNSIIYQTNRYGKNGELLPNNVAVFVDYKSDENEGLAVTGFESSINPDFIREEFGDAKYHTVVTVFEPDTQCDGLPFDYVEELLQNPNNFELKIERRYPARSATGENHPNTSSKLPSNTIKAQNSFGVNSYSMQDGGENSQFSFGEDLTPSVALESIKKDRVVSMGVPKTRSHVRTSPVNISISKILSNVNPQDTSFTKYIPRQFLEHSSGQYSFQVDDSNDVAEVEVQGQEIPEGSTFAYQDAKNAEPTSSGMTNQNGGEGPDISSASDTRVPQNSFGVNSYDMQNGGEIHSLVLGRIQRLPSTRKTAVRSRKQARWNDCSEKVSTGGRCGTTTV